MADLEVGQMAPNFSAQTQDGHVVTLEALRGRVVVLYFYPKDDTPGCTNEACAFRDVKGELADAGATVYGVSKDSVDSHQKFSAKYELNFPLLADVDGTICDAYGVIKEKVMFGKRSIGIERTTFIIDKGGVIVKVFPRVRVDGHVNEVLAIVKSLA